METAIKKELQEVKKIKAGIYFKINARLHFYHIKQNIIVLCTETSPGKYWYSYGSNLTNTEEKEIINNLKTTT